MLISAAGSVIVVLAGCSTTERPPDYKSFTDSVQFVVAAPLEKRDAALDLPYLDDPFAPPSYLKKLLGGAV